MAENRKRARNKKGHYIADDPTTPDINEAYERDSFVKFMHGTTFSLVNITIFIIVFAIIASVAVKAVS
tara:strand:+ start:94 stop:297 length:204 start_codon:yes stop_codon:yes gene_type:complete